MNLNEQKPMPMDTPNEFAYTDFKKWAYKNRTAVKNILVKALKDNRGDGTYLFLALTQVWLAWANKKAKQWTGVPKGKTPAAKDFGRALAVMMKKDNLIITKSGNKLTNVNEIKKGDWIRSAYDELGLVNKVKGQAAYVSFDGSRSFQPMRVSDLKKTKERYKGKAVYSEGKLTEGSKANRWFDNLKYYYEKGLSSPDLKDPAEKKAYTKLAKQFFSKLREGKLTESMIGIQTKANFKPNTLKGALEKAGIKGFQMNRLSVTLTALKLDKKYFEKAKKIIDSIPTAKIQMAKESVNESDLPPDDKAVGKQMTLPVDEQVVLRAGTDEHARGLLVTYKSTGGYDIQYWYGTPDKVVPAELKGDGKSVGEVETAWFGYHASVDEGRNDPKIACLKCDEVNTRAKWKKNKGVCPSCNDSRRGVAEGRLGSNESSNIIKY